MEIAPKSITRRNVIKKLSPIFLLMRMNRLYHIPRGNATDGLFYVPCEVVITIFILIGGKLYQFNRRTSTRRVIASPSAARAKQSLTVKDCFALTKVRPRNSTE